MRPALVRRELRAQRGVAAGRTRKAPYWRREGRGTRGSDERLGASWVDVDGPDTMEPVSTVELTEGGWDDTDSWSRVTTGPSFPMGPTYRRTESGDVAAGGH